MIIRDDHKLHIHYDVRFAFLTLENVFDNIPLILNKRTDKLHEVKLKVLNRYSLINMLL